MDDILKQAQDLVDGPIDFEGQKFTETISTVMLSLVSALALLVGFIQKDIFVTMWLSLIGLVLTLLIVVPPWPFFNQHPPPWLGSRTRMSVPHGGIVISGIKTS